MKSSIVIFWVVAVYFLLIGTLYTLWNYSKHSNIEWAGSVAVYGAGALAAFIAVYLMLVQRKQGGTLIEDLPDSDIDDGDPELGEFSPWSWWPIVLAFGAAVFILGLCLPWGYHWLMFFGAPILVVSIVGWVFEYYRGHFAR